MNPLNFNIVPSVTYKVIAPFETCNPFNCIIINYYFLVSLLLLFGLIGLRFGINWKKMKKELIKMFGGKNK